MEVFVIKVLAIVMIFAKSPPSGFEQVLENEAIQPWDKRQLATEREGFMICKWSNYLFHDADLSTFLTVHSRHQ